jgi:hypothetical protein
MAKLKYFMYGGFIGLAIKALKDRDMHSNPSGDSCPLATKDLKVNTRNRDKAIKASWIQYGPLNLSDNQYWKRLAAHWKTTEKVAKESRCGNCVAFDISPSMIDCMTAGPVSKDIEDADGILGYCHMHHFKCHSARTCYTWAAGGPITEDAISMEWQSKTEK